MMHISNATIAALPTPGVRRRIILLYADERKNTK
jgi:hypothetical protein